eukprot:395657-Pleurochrysis_carterae.AAC.16
MSQYEIGQQRRFFASTIVRQIGLHAWLLKRLTPPSDCLGKRAFSERERMRSSNGCSEGWSATLGAYKRI